MLNEVAIKVDHVSKTFKLPHEKTTSIKGAVVNFWRRSRTYEKQQALKDVSLEIKKGEFFGIVGRNGSGKSTLLKLLAGIYSPSEGSVQVNGRLTPFIELGVGFNPELTGRENVYLNGALLGFSRKEVSDMYGEIVEFAELQKFMDQKLKNYSSGMQVRLAFSIAIRARTDILLIDEVLAVGDTAFQKKCYEVFTALKREGKTIIFVTHDMAAVERFCDRALVISEGTERGIYPPSEASSIYDQLNISDDSSQQKKLKRWGSGDVLLKDVRFYSKGKPLKDNIIHMGSELEIRLTTESKSTRKITVGLAFEDVFGVNISGPNSRGVGLTSQKPVSYKIDRVPLLPGSYAVTVAIFDESAIREYDYHDRAFELRVVADSHNLHGKINLFGQWEQR